jgi:hypothetical protein
LRDVKNRAVSSENMPASAREWTPVPPSSFPRNEGVRGSSPRVAFPVEEVRAYRKIVLSRQARRAHHRE